MIPKLIGSVCATLLLLSLNPSPKEFEKYKAIEAREVRPGILMMPKYDADGNPCEVVIQRQHYVDGIANLYFTIPHDELLRIIDELAPASERGPAFKALGQEYVSLTSGNSITTFAEYKNVKVDIVGLTEPASSAGDMVALIHWKDRRCQ